MSNESKSDDSSAFKTIIGLVVLGALGYVVYSLWKQKKTSNDNDKIFQGTDTVQRSFGSRVAIIDVYAYNTRMAKTINEPAQGVEIIVKNVRTGEKYMSTTDVNGITSNIVVHVADSGDMINVTAIDRINFKSASVSQLVVPGSTVRFNVKIFDYP